MNQDLLSGRRKFLLGSVGLAVSSLFFCGKSQITQAAVVPANARLGVNIASIVDWNTELPFVDMFRMSRTWISQPATGAWGTGPLLDLDANGWVKKLEAGCRATRMICSNQSLYPSGNYTILYDGEGELKLTHPIGTIVKSVAGQMVIKISADKGLFGLDLITTNPSNYVRNIRVIMPTFETSYQSNPWHPNFLKRWSGIACIRLMDLMATNNSFQVNWSDRPTLLDAGFTSKGVPVELLVDLANRLKVDAWFCMPHQASDDYVQKFATYVSQNLAPTVRAWVEYSNEVWNSQFQQSKYAGAQGLALGFASTEWENAWRYTAYRSVQLFNIWQQAFGGRDRLVRVLASQASNAYVSDQIASFQNAASSADVLAIAPYISFNVPVTGSGITADAVSKWTLTKLFDYLNKVSLPQSSTWITDNKKVADTYTLKLVAYEGGQHLAGVEGAENNQKLTNLLISANADKRMGDLYTLHLANWQRLGGDLMCVFNSVDSWSKWGSWGLLRSYKELTTSSPKFSAVMKWAISRGQKVTL